MSSDIIVFKWAQCRSNATPSALIALVCNVGLRARVLFCPQQRDDSYIKTSCYAHFTAIVYFRWRARVKPRRTDVQMWSWTSLLCDYGTAVTLRRHVRLWPYWQLLAGKKKKNSVSSASPVKPGHWLVGSPVNHLTFPTEVCWATQQISGYSH